MIIITDYMTSLISQMERLRREGQRWADIAEELGYGNAKSAKSTYCRELRRRQLTVGAASGSGEPTKAGGE